MIKIIEFIALTLTAISLLSLIAFIIFVLIKISEWIEDNRIIEKWLDKMFRAGEQNE